MKKGIQERFSQGGFSLIEMLVYVAILASIAVVVVNVAVVLAESYGTLQATRNINISAVTALERVVHDVRVSKNVDVGNSTLGSHPGRLTLTRATTTPTTSEFYLDNGILKVREDGVVAGSLTNDNTSVTNLVFRHVVSGSIELVKIEATLESTVGTTTKTENFFDSIILRGSY